MTTKALAPVGTARSHIRRLVEEGASYPRIAKAAGVKSGFVAGILYGDGTRQRKVADAASVKRILTLTLDDIPEPEDLQRRTPQPGAQRRVQALAAKGFPWSVIARQCEVQREVISLLARDGHTQKRTAELVNAAYKVLRDTAPEAHRVTRHVEERTRNTAVDNGWRTPAWWDTNGGIDHGTPPTAPAKRELPETPAKGWEAHAACLGEDPELWFPTGYTTADNRRQVSEAKTICGRCPVRELCLAAALRRENADASRDGIYGGQTPAERWPRNEEEAA